MCVRIGGLMKVRVSRGWVSLRWAAALLVSSCLLVSGCGRSFLLEEEIVKLCRGYTENVAARKYDKAMEMLTGDALESFRIALPAIEALEISSKVSGWKGKVDWMNRPKDRASVAAEYLMEQTVPGYGTALTDYEVVYDLKKTASGWKIYSIKAVRKQERRD